VVLPLLLALISTLFQTTTSYNSLSAAADHGHQQPNDIFTTLLTRRDSQPFFSPDEYSFRITSLPLSALIAAEDDASFQYTALYRSLHLRNGCCDGHLSPLRPTFEQPPQSFSLFVRAFTITLDWDCCCIHHFTDISLFIHLELSHGLASARLFQLLDRALFAC
jgi:hypothetical protein